VWSAPIRLGGCICPKDSPWWQGGSDTMLATVKETQHLTIKDG